MRSLLLATLKEQMDLKGIAEPMKARKTELMGKKAN